MSKQEAGRDATLDDELPPVLGPVMSGTQDDHRLRIMLATLGSRHNVMYVDEHRVATSRNHAASAVSPYDLAAHGWWHALASANPSRLGRRDMTVVFVTTHVGQDCFSFADIYLGSGNLPRAGMLVSRRAVRSLDSAQLLGITARHLDNLRSHFDLLSPALLPTAPAPLADGERNLVARAPR